MATRKDYRETAAIINAALRAPMSDAERYRVESLAFDFAALYGRAGAFDSGRFAEACGLSTDSKRAMYAGNRQPAKPETCAAPAPETPARTRKPAARPFLTDQEASDALSAADIGYWAQVASYAPDSHILFYDAERQPAGEPIRVTLADISRAADRVLRERLANDEILADIARRDIDATAGDVLIQVAAFGEIVYS